MFTFNLVKRNFSEDLSERRALCIEEKTKELGERASDVGCGVEEGRVVES